MSSSRKHVRRLALGLAALAAERPGDDHPPGASTADASSVQGNVRTSLRRTFSERGQQLGGVRDWVLRNEQPVLRVAGASPHAQATAKVALALLKRLPISAQQPPLEEPPADAVRFGNSTDRPQTESTNG
jgi:hypothetical protein